MMINLKYNNVYLHIIGKKPSNADYCALTETTETNQKLLSLKLMIESEFLSIRTILVKVTLKIGQEKYLLSILF